jgi:7-cyano-7-deazaguanine synthase
MVKTKSKVQKTNVIICCSGGIDSTALIHYYLDKGYQIQCVHFDYGQPALKAEIKALKGIEKYFDVKVESLVLRPKPKYSSSGECYGRNALFVLSVISQMKKPKTLISLGIHSNSIYYDSSEVFAQQLQEILNGYFHGLTRLDAPFLKFSKRDILEYCIKNRIPLDLTFSCDQSSSKPCGKCSSCKERAGVLNGFNR